MQGRAREQERGERWAHPLARRPRARAASRTLVVVPILHSEVDLGSLAPGLAPGAGEAERARWRLLVQTFWARVREGVLALRLPWRDVRLYQDGLPLCGREAEIVAELARRGSWNHALLLDLVARGAMLVGTEEPGLLLRELEMARRIGGAPDPASRRALLEELRAEMDATLAARDGFIARRIDGTLSAGGSGVLFVGALHRVESHLPDDVTVRRIEPSGGAGA